MKTTILGSLIAVSIGSLLMVGNAMATPIYATSIDHVVVGANFDTTHSTTEARWDTGHALGAPDGDFFSMGQGGAVVFGFDALFDTEASVIEITYGNRNNYNETAEVYVWSGANDDVFGVPVGTSSGWEFVGNITNNTLSNSVSLAGVAGNPFKYLGIVDTSSVNNGDGFDIDAVSVNPVPEPATMLLFGTGLIGLVGFSRRKKK